MCKKHPARESSIGQLKQLCPQGRSENSTPLSDTTSNLLNEQNRNFTQPHASQNGLQEKKDHNQK